MLITVIILASLLAVSVGVAIFQIYFVRRVYNASLDALHEAAINSGVCFGHGELSKKAGVLLERRREENKAYTGALREMVRQRRDIIAFLRIVREFQDTLDAAPGIHVRKDFILEFLLMSATHFKMEKV